MRLIFEKAVSGQGEDTQCDMLVYFADERLSVHFRTPAIDPFNGEESYHFKMVWRGEVGTAVEMMTELITAEYYNCPLIYPDDLSLIRESLIKAIDWNRRHVQRSMNLSIVAGIV